MKYDFNNPAHWKELERQAYNGTVDVTRFPPAAYRYFDSLRKLYRSYRFEGLPKEAAGTQKAKLLAQYHEAVSVFENAMTAHQQWQDNIRRSELLRTAVTKSNTVTDKLRFAIEAIGAMTGDEVFVRTELAKLEEVQDA